MRRITTLTLVCWILGIFQAFASLGYSEESKFTENSTANPIRISRAFFRNSLVGEIAIESSKYTAFKTTNKSPVVWVEHSPTGPEPQPGALADFRDRLGCAYFVEAGSLAVCFNMMGDVFSLGVNSREMKFLGIQDYIKVSYQTAVSSEYNCQPDIKNFSLEGASGSEGVLELSLTANTFMTQAEYRIGDDSLRIKFKISTN